MLRLAKIVGKPGRVGEVLVKEIKPDNTTTSKGSRTWNTIVKDNFFKDQGRVMRALRLKGEMVANHFHPKAKNKDPERFEIIHGEIEFWFEDLYGNKRVENISVDFKKDNPVSVDTPAYILHGINVLSDFAYFEEFQTGPYDPEVYFSPDEFSFLKKKFLEKGPSE